jgi:dihydrofolate synthase/folylpolyglutamate synthase
VWPARIQPLKGRLRDQLPASSELWLDGAHNAHGAAALAVSLEEMNRVRPKPLVLILGMMNTREPRDFLEPFKPMAPRVLTLTIPGEENAHRAGYIASEAKAAGFDARAYRALGQAIDEAAKVDGARVVICGSLYLGGYVLEKNGTPPE